MPALKKVVGQQFFCRAKKMFVLFLLLFIPFGESARKVTIDEIDGQKFDFKLFENVDGSIKVYQQEKLLIGKLKDIREELKTAKKSMKNNLHKSDILTALKAMKMSIKSTFENVQNLTSEFPRVEDFDGAIRGLFAIFYTYQFNLTEAMQSGKFEYFDATKGHIRSFESHEKLDIMDGESMLNLAMIRKTYSAGVWILKSIFDSIKWSKNGIKKSIFKRLDKKKKTLIKLNNGYLLKSEMILCRLPIKYYKIPKLPNQVCPTVVLKSFSS